MTTRDGTPSWLRSRRALGFSALFLVATGCTKPSGPSAPPDAGVTAQAVAAAEPECTLATPLVPGVPGSPGHLLPSERNPNGDSELAALMRRMVADWQSTRAVLLDGGTGAAPPRWPVHRTLRCAWPTDPADRNAQFDGLAQGYLEAVKRFDATPGRETYGGVLGACAACHEVTCGGPLAVIESLQLR